MCLNENEGEMFVLLHVCWSYYELTVCYGSSLSVTEQILVDCDSPRRWRNSWTQRSGTISLYGYKLDSRPLRKLQVIGQV